MAANAIKGAGTKLEVKLGAGAYTVVGGVKSVSGIGGGSAATIDTSDLASPRKEKQMGLADEGQISVSLTLLPKDAGQIIMRTARGTQAALVFRITLADTTKLEGTGFVTVFGRDVGGVDDVVMASATIEVTGEIIETPAV